MLTLDYVLNSSNINGEIYRCDVDRLFGIDFTPEKRTELHTTLNSIRNAFALRVQGANAGHINA